MAFYVGQKVVCVDARPDAWGYDTLLTDGAIYTVAGLCENWDGEAGITLCEIAIPYRNKKGWWARRFRPAVERKTDISIFTAMLTPKRQSVDA